MSSRRTLHTNAYWALKADHKILLNEERKHKKKVARLRKQIEDVADRTAALRTAALNEKRYYENRIQKRAMEIKYPDLGKRMEAQRAAREAVLRAKADIDDNVSLYNFIRQLNY
jgi:hypothetical protein